MLPREVLRRRGIVSAGGVGGKRAFRVYPPWAVTTSRQAAASQAWQAEYFLPVAPAAVDTGRARALHRP